MQRKKIKCRAVFFDLWDTLLLSKRVTVITQELMGLQSYGFHYFIRKFERATMTKRFSSFERFALASFKEFKLKPEKQKVGKIVALWRRHMQNAKLFPETLSVLRSLKKRGFKLAIVSNCQDLGIYSVLKRLRLLELFDSVQLSFEIHLLKPDKRLLERALKELKLEPREAIMVGDSKTDILGARNAKMRGILLDRSTHRKKYYKAVAVINNLEELLDLLEVG